MVKRVGSQTALLLAVLALLALACRTPTKPLQVQVLRAAQPPPEETLLDVGVLSFHPGVEPDEEPPERVWPRVRQAEATYLPVLLRRTLADTGYWGVVRVLPAPSHNVDLTIAAKILESDGEHVAMHVNATDATGRVWLNRKYETGTAALNFAPPQTPHPTSSLPTATQPLAPKREDPYQAIFNQIANDLLAERGKLAPTEIERLRQTAELRFAQEFAPEAFAGYLKEKRARFELERLPAEGDPALDRVRAVRERDALFVDTMNEHYNRFVEEMAEHYLEWRKVSREETLRYMELKNQVDRERAGAALLAGLAVVLAAQDSSSRSVDRATTAAAVASAAAALGAFVHSFETSEEAKMHHTSLQELGESFNAEVTPIVVRIAGDEARLTGNAAAQYEQWKEWMRRLYEAETAIGEQQIVFETSPVVEDKTSPDGATPSDREAPL